VSDKNDDFLSFEKALRELNMRSEELKKLVSEGEIRAFRDGDSMKFRADDIKALTAKSEGETKLSFADSLEDDTGMVTEQISEEDTLLAEEDEVVEEKPRRGAAARGRAAAAPVVAVAAGQEPKWVTAVGVVAFLIAMWGCMITWNIVTESNPKDSPVTSVFANEKAK